MQPVKLITAAVACGIAAACASGPQPTEQLARAHALVEQADKSQAQRYAPADLQRARDELQQAEVANGKRDYDVARAAAESAGVDADLASARASEGEARRAANEARRSNVVLEHEEQNGPAAQAPATAPDTVPAQSLPPDQAPPPAAQPMPEPDQTAPPRQPPQGNDPQGAAP